MPLESIGRGSKHRYVKFLTSKNQSGTHWIPPRVSQQSWTQCLGGQQNYRKVINSREMGAGVITGRTLYIYIYRNIREMGLSYFVVLSCFKRQKVTPSQIITPNHTLNDTPASYPSNRTLRWGSACTQTPTLGFRFRGFLALKPA